MGENAFSFFTAPFLNKGKLWKKNKCKNNAPYPKILLVSSEFSPSTQGCVKDKSTVHGIIF